MKTLLFIAFFSVIALYSCTNKLSDPKAVTYSMSAVVDGKYETFASGDSVRGIGTSGAYVTGLNDTTSDRIGIYVVNSQGVLVPGTYTTDTASNNPHGAQLLLYPASDYNHYYYSYYIQGVDNFTCTVTITSVDSTEVKGTFSGNIVWVDYISGTSALKTKNITNGQFNIKLKP